MRSAKDFFAPLAVGAPDSAPRDPGPPQPGDPLLRPEQPQDGRQDPGHGRQGRRAARQPRGRHQGRQQARRPRGPGEDRAGHGLRTHPAVDPDQRARLPLGPRRPDHAGLRDRRQARRGDGAEGAGRRGHPLRRPAARPARGQGRAGPADPGARDPRDRARHGEHRGDLRRLAADAGSLARPGRPRRRPPDEDDPGRRRSPGLPGAPGPGVRTEEDIDGARAVVPAGPVALHDRPDGRRLRDARDLPLLRAVRRHRRRGRLRGPVPQRVPARLRRHLVAAPQADRHRQQGVQPVGRRTSRTRAGSSRRWATAPAR